MPPSDGSPITAVPKTEITIVLPVLNEELAVGKVIDELKSSGYSRILVVDGRSSDASRTIASKKGAIVRIQDGFGKVGAILTAFQEVDTDFAVVMDGDYSYDASDIEKLLTRANGYDMIIGVRDRSNMLLRRQIGNLAVRFLCRVALRLKLRDICSGFYLIRVPKAKMIRLSKGKFTVEVELAFQMSRMGSIGEVPINYRPRFGNSKLSLWKDGLAITFSIFQLATNRFHSPWLAMRRSGQDRGIEDLRWNGGPVAPVILSPHRPGRDEKLQVSGGS